MASDSRTRVGDAFARIAWWLLLVNCALVPLAITNTSLFGSVGHSLTYDMVNLPKVAALIICSGLGLASYAISVALGSETPRFSVPVAILWALAAWSVVTAVASPVHYRAFFGDFDHNEGIAAFVAYATLATLAVQVVADKARLRTVALTLGTSATVVAAYGLLQFAHLDPLSWPPAAFGSRIFGTFENPDMLATFLVLPLALTLGVALSERRTSGVFWWTAAMSVCLEAALVVALVRGAWLGAVCALLLIAVALFRAGLEPESRRRLLGLVGAWLVGGVLAVLWLRYVPQSGVSVGERLGTTVATPLGGSVAERLATWRIAVRAIAARPVLGYSPGSFLDVFRANAQGPWWAAYGHALSSRDAHDLPLQYAVTLGIPGALAAIGAVIVALAQGVRLAFPKKGGTSRLLYSSLFAGTVGLFVALLSSLTMASIVVWLWLGVGLLSAPRSRPIVSASAVARVAAAALAVVLVTFASLGVVWMRADAIAANALRQSGPDAQLAEMDRAIAANPYVHEYKNIKASIASGAVQSAQKLGDPAVLQTWADRAVTTQRAAWTDDPHDELAAAQTLEAMSLRFAVTPDPRAAQQTAGLADQIGRTWPNAPDARYAAALAYVDANRLDAAAANARAAVELAPGFAEAWLVLGHVYVAQNSTGKARDAFQHVLALDPQNTDAAQALGSLGSPAPSGKP